jgi:hypothetical protein
VGVRGAAPAATVELSTSITTAVSASRSPFNTST